MFYCPMCTKTFSYSSALDRHMITHTKEKPHKCPMCPQAFGQKYSVKQHIRIVHHGIKQTRNYIHHCTMCSQKCYSKSLLEIHVRKYSAKLPFSCQLTGCGFKTKYKSHLTQHGRQAHSDKRSFKCPSDGCSYKAKTKSSIIKHLKFHSNDKPFHCTVSGCNFTSKSKRQLKVHTSTVHSNEKPFKCPVCDFKTKYNKSLRQHQLTYTNIIKRFQCQAPNCGFASKTRNYLKVHFDRKHRTKKVLCTEPKCKYRCGNVADLKIHLKRHDLPILKCPSDSCGFRTRYNRGLLGHISRRHKDFQSSDTVVGTRKSDLKTAGTMNTLQCSFADCGYETKFPHLYNRHVIAHKKKGKRNYVCTFCHSRFIKLCKLKSHIQRHTGEKPYNCSYCGHKTVTSSELRRHAEKVHRIHVIPLGKEEVKRDCRTCNMTLSSYAEFVLHSMTHLRPIVVLERLRVHVY